VSTESLIGEAYGVSTSLTPSGLEIYYQAGPKRLYKIRGESPGNWRQEDWRVVPSVSTVLDILEKGGLSWWGMKVGVEGVIELGRREKLALDETADEIVALLTAEKLTVNHVRDKAADRGTNVHSALESWVETGITPNPDLFPESERGYVQGLVYFINDAHPTAIYSELMVGSAEHGFAGRFDLFANLDFSGEVVTKTYPKRTPLRETFQGTGLIDIKTSKSVYSSHHLQLAGYEGAMVEGGYPAPDWTAVLRLTDDGRYELVRGVATFDDFLAIKGAYDALKGIK
jgi:hypothetical protein